MFETAFTRGFRRAAGHRSARRLAASAVAVIAGSAVATAGAGSAGAHVTAQMYGATATSGGYGAVFLRVPHGCGGDATNAITVTIPDGVDPAGVKPQQKAGWTATKVGSTISWSGGALPDSQFDDFGLSVKWPTLAVSETSRKVYFKTVQTCTGHGRGLPRP